MNFVLAGVALSICLYLFMLMHNAFKMICVSSYVNVFVLHDLVIVGTFQIYHLYISDLPSVQPETREG